jgi:VanZ family protein
MFVMDTNYAARGSGRERTRDTLSPRGPITLVRAGFVAAVLAQVWVLYLYVPSGSDTVTVPHADKLVHAAVFALPALLGVLARVRPWLVGAVLAVHAPVSEVVQHFWIPGRSGDPWDVVADLVGVALGLLLGSVLMRRRLAVIGGSGSAVD